MRGRSRLSLLIGLSAAISGSGCASSPPPRPHPPAPPPPSSSPAPTPPTAGSNAAKSFPPPNVEALAAALKGKGHTVIPHVDTKGRVGGLEYRGWDRSAVFVNSYPEPYVLAFMKAHGDALGYGPLGDASDEVAMDEEPSRGPASILVPYPKAAGCPGLAVVFRYTYMTDNSGLVGAPMGWDFLCPTEPDGIEKIQDARSRSTGTIHASREVTTALGNDPLVKWLVANGHGRPTMVDRTPDAFRVRLPDVDTAEPRSRMVLAREVAERAAAVSGLPKLDKATVSYTEGSRERPKEMASVTFSESRPSKGGVCVAPSVKVSVRLTYPGEKRPPSVDEVEVHCTRESSGPRPPADSARALPKSFATSPEYLVHCHSTSFAWGYSNSGLVVDRRGDVYSYNGGQPTAATTVSALTSQLGHGKDFHGTLPAADVESLVDLIPKVAKDKWQSKSQRIFDGPAGGCVYLRSGPTKDALVSVPLHSYDNHNDGHRDGDATRAAQRILDRAHTLKERGL